MVSRIAPTVVLRSGEAPLSFASRIAWRNGIASSRHMLTDVGLHFQNFVDGDGAELNAFAAMTGADPAKLAAHAMRREGEFFRLNGQHLTKTSVRRTNFRVCPLCLMNDIETSPDPAPFAPYVRTIWMLVPLRTCHIHNISFVQPGKRRTDLQWCDYALLLSNMAPSLGDMAANAERRKPSSLESYLLGRLGFLGLDEAVDPWVDELEWRVVAKTAELIGGFDILGRKFCQDVISDETWRKAGAKGFDVMREGPSAVTRRLKKMYDTFPLTSRSKAEAQAVLGSLYLALARTVSDEAFAPVRALVSDFVVNNFDVGEGDLVLGRRLESRTVHSIRSASTAWDAHPKRLRKILLASGVMRPEQAALPDYRVLMPAKEVDAIAAADKERADLVDLKRMLGVSLRLTRFIVAAGMIRPVEWLRPDAGAKVAFSKADVNAFITELAARAEPVKKAPPGALDVVAAAKKCRFEATLLLRTILDGNLKSLWKVENAAGLKLLAVDPSEIMALKREMVRELQHFGPTPREATEKLKTSFPVVQALLANGLLTTESLPHPTSCAEVAVIPKAQIDAFDAKYINLHSISLERRQYMGDLSRELAQRGIHPVWSPSALKSSWYLRADLAALPQQLTLAI